MTDPNRIDRLRAACASPLPQPAVDVLRAAASQVSTFLLDDFQTLGDRLMGDVPSRAEMERLLREPPPEVGQGFPEVFAEFQEKIVPHSLRPSHPRFFAFVPAAPTFVSVMGDWLCAGLNFFGGLWKESPAAAQVEILVLDWFKEFLGYPAEARGILTGGGSEANLISFVVARDRLPTPLRQRAMVYVSEQRHWSIDRAGKIIGLRQDQIHTLPPDDDNRLDLRRLQDALTLDRRWGRVPWLVIANAGATNTGTVDPLSELADLCQREHLWMHVDAAYGWPAVLTSEGKRTLRGIERADSITLDPHKWFAQPYEAGCVMVKRGQDLSDTFLMRPEYLQDTAPDEGEINFADHGIALTRRFRALKIWFSIKVLGVSWFRQLIEHSCKLAELTQALLEEGPFEIVSARHLSIVCFRYVPAGKKLPAEALDRINHTLCARVCQSGRALLSTTQLRGRTAIRFCFVNWRTTTADVEETVKLLIDLGQKITG